MPPRAAPRSLVRRAWARRACPIRAAAVPPAEEFALRDLVTLFAPEPGPRRRLDHFRDDFHSQVMREIAAGAREEPHGRHRIPSGLTSEGSGILNANTTMRNGSVGAWRRRYGSDFPNNAHL